MGFERKGSIENRRQEDVERMDIVEEYSKKEIGKQVRSQTRFLRTLTDIKSRDRQSMIHALR